MIKMFSLIAATLYLLAAYNVSAQTKLPDNPWKAQTNAAVQSETKGNTSNALPSNPWTSNKDLKNWRGSGQYGKLNYTGSPTTYTKAQGQEMIAPEVNRDNMIIGLKQLRKMGYKIPESYDQKVRDMPQAYGNLLKENYSKVYQLSDPLGKGFTRMMDGVEDGTGLDIENLLFNSISVLSSD